jgi:hypothetical protein
MVGFEIAAVGETVDLDQNCYEIKTEAAVPYVLVF